MKTKCPYCDTINIADSKYIDCDSCGNGYFKKGNEVE